jgi:hypothetical protein
MMIAVALIACCVAACEHLMRQIRSEKLSRSRLALVDQYGRQAKSHLESERSFERLAQESRQSIESMVKEIGDLQRISDESRRQGQLDWEMRRLIRDCRSLILRQEAHAEYWSQMAKYHGWWGRAYQRAASHPWERLPQGPPEPIEPVPAPDAPATPEEGQPGRLT